MGHWRRGIGRAASAEGGDRQGGRSSTTSTRRRHFLAVKMAEVDVHDLLRRVKPDDSLTSNAEDVAAYAAEVLVAKEEGFQYATSVLSELFESPECAAACFKTNGIKDTVRAHVRMVMCLVVGVMVKRGEARAEDFRKAPPKPRGARSVRSDESDRRNGVIHTLQTALRAALPNLLKTNGYLSYGSHPEDYQYMLKHVFGLSEFRSETFGVRREHSRRCIASAPCRTSYPLPRPLPRSP
jgi:hypothetical protein